MKVHLVRHTSVVWDGSIVCYGNTDVAVRDTFETEAQHTLRRLSGLTPEAVFTSPLSRASQLATYCGYAHAIHDDRLKEMNFGSWEGRLWEDIIGDQEIGPFFERYINEPTPGGESQQMQYDRVEDFILEKKAEGLHSILVFCHGGVINCARVLAGQVALREAFITIPDFGSLTTLSF